MARLATTAEGGSCTSASSSSGLAPPATSTFVVLAAQPRVGPAANGQPVGGRVDGPHLLVAERELQLHRVFRLPLPRHILLNGRAHGIGRPLLHGRHDGFQFLGRAAAAVSVTWLAPDTRHSAGLKPAQEQQLLHVAGVQRARRAAAAGGKQLHAAATRPPFPDRPHKCRQCRPAARRCRPARLRCAAGFRPHLPCRPKPCARPTISSNVGSVAHGLEPPQVVDELHDLVAGLHCLRIQLERTLRGDQVHQLVHRLHVG